MITEAVINWLTGLVLGLATAVCIVFLSSRVFPELEDFGVDLGMRVGVNLAAHAALDTVRESGITGYVFLDIDSVRPQFPDAACRALLKAPRENRTEFKGPPTLACEPNRAANRYLLAELVNQLSAQDAALIVLDVELTTDSPEFQAGETQALAGELTRATTPVIYAIPVSEQLPAQSNLSDPYRDVVSESENPLMMAPPSKALPAVALAYPDIVTRRYARYMTVLTGASGSMRMPTLPFAPARAICERAVSKGECTGKEERLPQRIVYTLPNLTGDVDGEVSSEAARIQARYAPVVRHCLAENLWDPSKQCASPNMYRNKVVIIGASNAARRDQHQTPIGSMPGALLVLNAIRSFVLFPELEEHSLWRKMGSKAALTFECSLVWLAYALYEKGFVNRRKRSHIRRGLLLSGASIVALIGSVSLAIALSLRQGNAPASVDVLLPVLAIAVEKYADAAVILVRTIDHALERLAHRLGLT